MEESDIVRLKQLAVGYSAKGIEKPLIAGIDLQIRKGEVVCLLGQNGVGKSTLLRTITGIQAPLSGSIELHGRPLEAYSLQSLAAAISIVLTEKVAAGNLLTEELVALGRHPYTGWLGLLSSNDKAVVDEAISLTKINYLLGKKISELSDGQYQKAMIARAVAQDSDLMVLDEPTAFLDLNNSVEIFLLLRQLAHEKQKAIVVSTHDFHLAMEFADRLWLANFNAPLYEGLPEDLALNGKLEEVMYHEGFGLDLLSGRIRVEKMRKEKISVVGSSKAHEWTKRALERNGFIVANDKSSTPVNIVSDESSISWTQGNATFFSLQDLLRFLNKKTAG